jgi:myosin-1
MYVFLISCWQLFALEHMRDRYWHNMAARIQRAWRNYIRYKNECANRIQRFWKNKKEGIVYVDLRDYGHQVLASRKERRRFSLLSMRQFRGDYLGVQSKDPQGDLLRSVCGISGGLDPANSYIPEELVTDPRENWFSAAEHVAFSAPSNLLVSKFGRSSKPSPRHLIAVCCFEITSTISELRAE